MVLAIRRILITLHKTVHSCIFVYTALQGKKRSMEHAPLTPVAGK
jgi:hypothetical protein